jgi:hypothetical protein
LETLLLPDVGGELLRLGFPADGLVVVGPGFKAGDAGAKEADANFAVNLGGVQVAAGAGGLFRDLLDGGGEESQKRPCGEIPCVVDVVPETRAFSSVSHAHPTQVVGACQENRADMQKWMRFAGLGWMSCDIRGIRLA